MLYRKKPVIVEAMQYDGDWDTAHSWLIGIHYDGPVRQNDDQSLTIPTLEGDHRADVGDWLIRSLQGELYPCKPDIFAATYEPVGDKS